MAKAAKPKKPRKDYPLFAHSSGQWAKTIDYSTVYFGLWNDRQGAEKRYRDWVDGVEPDAGEGMTVRLLLNHFLTHKQELLETGELKPDTFHDYKECCDRIILVFGRGKLVKDLQPLDFQRLRKEFASTHGLVALKKDIVQTRSVFKFARETFGLNVLYGASFSAPKADKLRTLRAEQKAERGKRMLEPAEIRLLVKAASPQLRAMIWLGANCGFGCNDCAMLKLGALDLKYGWIRFARPKTGIDRRSPLWRETCKALAVAIDQRPTPKSTADAQNVFITEWGNLWGGRHVGDSPISKEFTKLLKELKLHRAGVGFSALRHGFQTVAGRTGDKDGIRVIMGHVAAASDMSAVYDEEGPSDARLIAIVAYVRRWLMGKIG